jgi:hypothetical protein
MKRDASSPAGLGRAQRVLVGIVLVGALIIAAIGFTGSYSAVRELAEDKGFGAFAAYFPVGIDAGIVVLLALDLLLTWLRIPFPLLRQTAWLLTAATIAFNGAAAWGDPLAVSMHGAIPLLFIITIEAARHAIGRVADITADKHMEGVRFWRWFLSPIPTFRLWRRMKLWELRSYEEAVELERNRLVYQAHLRARYGRAWRRKAPTHARMPLRLANLGVPLPAPGDVPDVLEDVPEDIADVLSVTGDVPEDNTIVVRADKGADKFADNAPLADNGIVRELSAASPAMSAPRESARVDVPVDNAGRPREATNAQAAPVNGGADVREDGAASPAPAAAVAALSAAPGAAGSVVRADNEADTDADKARRADNASDAADTAADKSLPRGALAEAVRHQLAVGERDPEVITTRVRAALGSDIPVGSVRRTLRRELNKTAEPPQTGAYL